MIGYLWRCTAAIVVFASIGACTTTAAPTTPTTTTTTAAPATCERVTDAVTVSPGDDVNSAIQSHPAGTSFMLTEGTYRIGGLRPKEGQSFHGERDADCNRLATLNGSIVVTTWSRSDGLWVADGLTRTVASGSVPCEPDAPRCNDPHDIYIGDTPLRQAASKAAVTADSFFFDYEKSQVWIGVDPAGRTIELSMIEAAFLPSASNVSIVGFNLVKYANKPQYGVIGRHGTGNNWSIRDNNIHLSHSVGVVLNAGGELIDNVIIGQGGLGVKIRGDDVIARGNVVADNGWAGVLASWEGGGIKISAQSVVVESNCVQNNRGSGIWGDEHTADLLVNRNVVFDNVKQGVFFEISNGAMITNNMIGRNGEADNWLYGGQVTIATSSRATVTSNTVEVAADRGNAITIIWQDRGLGTSSVDSVVSDNDITFLGKNGVSGMRTDFAGGASIYERNVFLDNRYHAAATDHTYFRGVQRGAMTLSQTKAVGQERGSTFDTDVRPVAWSCALTRTVTN